MTGCGEVVSPSADAASDGAKHDAATLHDAAIPDAHRTTAVPCPADRGPGPPTQPYSPAQSRGCASDSDCDAGMNGRCFPFEGLVGPGGCSYDECLTDSTCGPNTPCACRASATDNAANVCDTGGNCAVDSDCGPGGFCSPSPACGLPRYFCHTAADTCVNDGDCPPVNPGTGSCETSSSCSYDSLLEHWVCNQFTCCLP